MGSPSAHLPPITIATEPLPACPYPHNYVRNQRVSAYRNSPNIEHSSLPVVLGGRNKAMAATGGKQSRAIEGKASHACREGLQEIVQPIPPVGLQIPASPVVYGGTRL